MKHGKSLFVLALSLPTLFSCGNRPTQIYYTVTFNPNGGEITSGSSTVQVKSGSAFNQCITPVVTKTDKVFKYWTFDATGEDKVNPSFKINQNITVYARLNDAYHTITFDANGGSVDADTKNVPDGTLFSECDKPTASKDSSEFKYWTFDDIGNETISTNYEVESNFTVYAQYVETGNIYFDAPEDSSIVTYGSTAVSYQGAVPSDIEIVSSNPSVITVEKDPNRNLVYLDAADGNVEDESTISIKKNGDVQDTINISVHHPTSVQEAAESFDFALGRGIYDITLTFNYDNQDSYSDFINDRLETRLSVPYTYSQHTQWTKGVNQTNRLHFSPSSLMATKSKDISQPAYSKYYYENLKNAAYELRHSKIVKRTDDHFAIDDAKKRLEVHNSETLFFALERRFRPVFDESEIAVSGSVAQRAKAVYDAAREACADAFGTETTDNLMKVRQLFEWLVNKTHYDHWIVSEEATEAEDFWEWSSYFPEGVFLNNGIAVCDGFSKALAIMGGIEGLPIIRSAGFADAGGHAWNYYHHSDNKWYLICPTWAHDDNDADSEYVDYNYSAITYQPFMTQSNYFYDHTYKTAYNYYRNKTKAEQIAQQYNFDEVLFNDITKSNTPVVSNIYTTDVFDPAKHYDYDLNSNTEATALGNTIPIMNEDFCINLSYNSKNYTNALWTAIKNRMTSAQRGITSSDYSHTDCTFIVKF